MTGIRISGFADEIGSSLDEQLGGLNKLGIENIEVRFVNGKNIADMTEDEVKELKTALDKNKILVSAIGSPIGKCGLDDDFSAHLKKAEIVFEYANILGAKYIRVFSFYPAEDGSLPFERVTEKMAMLIELADKYGVTLCHENEHGIFGENPDGIIKLVDFFKGKLRCVFDMGNFVLDGVSPLEAYSSLKEYIEYFHIKDATTDGVIVPPGLGDAKIKEIIALHKEYKGHALVSLEPHLTEFKGLSALTSNELKKEIKYDTPAEAFFDAAARLNQLLGE